MDCELYNEDCMNILRKMEDASVDLIVTDPPYNIETKGAGIYKQKDKQYVKELEGMKDGFSEDILEELCRVMKKINIYIFCSQKQIIPLLDFFVKRKKCNYNIISWHKTNPVPACGNKYLTDTEFVLFFREKGVKVYGSFETKKTWYVTPLNVIEKKEYGHPTVKPQLLLRNFIINSSEEYETVLDPFMGSGSTGVASVLTNRKFIGIEIDGKYFDTAKKRIGEEIKKWEKPTQTESL